MENSTKRIGTDEMKNIPFEVIAMVDHTEKPETRDSKLVARN